MAFVQINKTPSTKDLRWFGVAFFALIVVGGGVVRVQFHAPLVSSMIWVLGGAVCGVYALVPRVRRQVYLAWVYLTSPIGWTVSIILLGVVFFVVVAPIGVVMCLVKGAPTTKKARARGDELLDAWRMAKESAPVLQAILMTGRARAPKAPIYRQATRRRAWLLSTVSFSFGATVGLLASEGVLWLLPDTDPISYWPLGEERGLALPAKPGVHLVAWLEADAGTPGSNEQRGVR